MIKAIVAFFGILLGGMAGGQGRTGGKAPRRFGVPIIAAVWAFMQGLGWRSLAFLLWIPLLSMGYGVDSQLGALVGHIEWLIRLLYALLIALPFLVFGLTRWLIACSILIVAYAIRAGSLGTVSWFGDILVEDIVRFGALGGLVIFNGLTFKKEKV